MNLKNNLSSKVAIFGLVVLLVFLADWKYKQWSSENLIDKQKLSLLTQADALQKKNSELTQSLEYLNSTTFKESVARQQLNLKKQGEQVYTFTDTPEANISAGLSVNNSANATKWLNYFFGN